MLTGHRLTKLEVSQVISMHGPVAMPRKRPLSEETYEEAFERLTKRMGFTPDEAHIIIAVERDEVVGDMWADEVRHAQRARQAGQPRRQRQGRSGQKGA
jgi:hypothetical protein